MIPYEFLAALGMGSIISDKRMLDKALRLSAFSPDFCFEDAEDKKGRVFFARYKFLGRGFGCWVGGHRRKRRNKEGQDVEKYIVMEWGVFANAAADSIVSGVFVDVDFDNNAFCFALDEGSGNHIEFRVNNALELMTKYRVARDYDDMLDFERGIALANVSMLMAFATVLLPVEHSRKSRTTRVHDDIPHDITERDSDSMSFYENYEQQETDLRGRLANEDMLSVFEGFFLNLIEQSGIFSVLAEILHVDEIINELSQEKILRLDVDITGIKLSMYVNEKDLIGAPSEGMRVMGVGMAQGFVKLPSDVEINP